MKNNLFILVCVLAMCYMVIGISDFCRTSSGELCSRAPENQNQEEVTTVLNIDEEEVLYEYTLGRGGDIKKLSKPYQV